MTFDEFSAEVCERLRADMQSIRDPEGDIHPAAFHYFEGEFVRRFKIPRGWFSSNANKEVMARTFEHVNKLMRPRYFAWESTTYVAESDLVERERAVNPDKLVRDMPGRKEVVSLLTLSRDEARYYEAEITRDGRNPPVYGEWAHHEDAIDFKGRVLDPIMRSMHA